MVKISDVKKLSDRGKRNRYLKRLARMPLASLNYYLKNYENVVWVVGDGRSGTTWLSDLINWDKRYRNIFEPVHPSFVKQVKDFPLNTYLRPEDDASPLGAFLKKVFSGEFKHLRSDVSGLRLFYEGLLVKDIFANLLIGWVSKNILNVRKRVLLIRNPFSTALSKQKYKNGIWMTDAKQFLIQSQLVRDYLAPFEHLFHGVSNDFIENQILIWSVLHYVPFQQLDRSQVYIIFYENLFRNPQDELLKLFDYLYEARLTQLDASMEKVIYKPTRTRSQKLSALPREGQLDLWKNELSSKQIDTGQKILRSFGLDDIYRGDSLPIESSLEELLST